MAQFVDIPMTARVTQVIVDVDLLSPDGNTIGSASISGDTIADLLTKLPPLEPDPEPEPTPEPAPEPELDTDDASTL